MCPLPAGALARRPARAPRPPEAQGRAGGRAERAARRRLAADGGHGVHRVRPDTLGAQRGPAAAQHAARHQRPTARLPPPSARLCRHGAGAARLGAGALPHGGRALLRTRAAPVRRDAALHWLLGPPGHRGLRLHRVHGARQAHARRSRRAALRDARRRCRVPLRLRPRRGRGRLLPRRPLPRLRRAREPCGAPQTGVLLPQVDAGRAARQACARRDSRGPRAARAPRPAAQGY
mmetsp:Transcript_36829/g.88421  ORF Transcript_36829/g.88421 Transcript_36829/m.88421 type:complete len:234 (+) Transcript_36829:78-779(+)